MRILVVEEDADARAFLMGVLKEAGDNVEGYDNLCDAVRAMMRGPCDMLLMDIQLPGVPCETALSLLQEVAPGVPVVLTTADPGGRQAARGARAGAFRVVAKPFKATEILEAVGRAQASRGSALA